MLVIPHTCVCLVILCSCSEEGWQHMQDSKSLKWGERKGGEISLFLSGLLCFIFGTNSCHVAQASFGLVNLLEALAS